MKTPRLLYLSLALVCASCQVQSHLGEIYGANGQLKKREWDVNGQVGGVSSQKGADGSQNDFDGQASWNDTMTGATGIVAAKSAGKIGLAQEKTKQVGERQTTARAANARVPTVTTPTVDPATGQVLTPVVTAPAAAVGLGGGKKGL